MLLLGSSCSRGCCCGHGGGGGSWVERWLAAGKAAWHGRWLTDRPTWTAWILQHLSGVEGRSGRHLIHDLGVTGQVAGHLQIVGIEAHCGCRGRCSICDGGVLLLLLLKLLLLLLLLLVVDVRPRRVARLGRGRVRLGRMGFGYERGRAARRVVAVRRAAVVIVAAVVLVGLFLEVDGLGTNCNSNNKKAYTN